MANLRQQVIKLASEKPELRQHLVPVLRFSARRGESLAKYKGKVYRVLYQGPTRYGDRANLQFLDGSKSFWVDARLVTPHQGTPSSGSGATPFGRPRLRRDGTYECEECGDYVRPGTRCWETGTKH